MITTDKNIRDIAKAEIDKAFRAPNVIVNPNIIEAISKRVAIEVMEQHPYTGQTTNATPTVMAVVEVDDYTNGKIEVEVLALKDDGSAGATYTRWLRWIKTAGVLTLATLGDWFDDDLTVTILVQNDGSDNIEIEVTGVAATTIDWKIYVNKIQQLATVLP